MTLIPTTMAKIMRQMKGTDVSVNTRKPIRLENYDYGQNGAYFITVCVKDRAPILSKLRRGEHCSPEKTGDVCTELTDVGMIVDRAIRAISAHYADVSVDHYVVMPDHIHLLLRMDRQSGRAMLAPTAISEIIRQLKGSVTKQCGKAIWQKSFYDHVIRCEQDYLETWRYIDENPARRMEKQEI